MSAFARLTDRVLGLAPVVFRGEVTDARGMAMEVRGLERRLRVGDKCVLRTRDGRDMLCEAVGFRGGRSLVMAFGSTDGVGMGDRVTASGMDSSLSPDGSWLGRVVDALGRPIDRRGPLGKGAAARPTRADPPNGYDRRRVGAKLETGVRALDVFVPLCRGQRLGVFAGSGVGKSSLLSMLTRGSDADVNVIALVGERGREVQEFIHEDLGEEGMARSVVVVATSDEPPLMRRQAAWTAMAVAEHFRDLGLHVLFMMDSATRFAMAQREIGLSTGEPPTTKGYPPTVFAELPRLLERAGPGTGAQGDITGVFTVLVDGDDHNEPISDAVRGILDGHVVLDRKIGDRGRYPAINILRSVSRTLPGCHTGDEYELYRLARQMASAYDDMAEMIRIGAYQRGSDPRIDAAIAVNEPLERFLTQSKGEASSAADAFAGLADVLSPIARSAR